MLGLHLLHVDDDTLGLDVVPEVGAHGPDDGHGQDGEGQGEANEEHRVDRAPRPTAVTTTAGRRGLLQDARQRIVSCQHSTTALTDTLPLGTV